MKIPTNTFKRAIAEGRLQIGLWSQLAVPVAAEVVADAGFDFVVIDAEHAPNDVLTVLPQLQIVDRSATNAIVRMPWNDMVQTKRFLDIGAQTLLMPFIESAEEVMRAVSYVRYPPTGVRGVATMHRANRYGRVADYLDAADAEICLLAQVETKAAVDRLEEIAAVERLDGIFIGPSDLAGSMGHIGDPGHPEVQDVILKVPERMRALGKPSGILTPVEDQARRYIAAGYTFVAIGSDLALLANHTAALAARFQDLTQASE